MRLLFEASEITFREVRDYFPWVVPSMGIVLNKRIVIENKMGVFRNKSHVLAKYLYMEIRSEKREFAAILGKTCDIVYWQKFPGEGTIAGINSGERLNIIGLKNDYIVIKDINFLAYRRQ